MSKKDSAVVQDRDGEGKIVYLFLPLYKACSALQSFPVGFDIIYVHDQRGNLQDAINHNLVNGNHFPERDMVRLFRGTCEAVRAMHTYRAPVSSSRNITNGNAVAAAAPPARFAGVQNGELQHDDDDHDDQMLPHPEGDGDGGYSYDGVSVPLISRRRVETDGDVVFDGDAELEQLRAEQPLEHGSNTEIVPYAHRDIKPG